MTHPCVNYLEISEFLYLQWMSGWACRENMSINLEDMGIFNSFWTVVTQSVSTVELWGDCAKERCSLEVIVVQNGASSPPLQKRKKYELAYFQS